MHCTHRLLAVVLSTVTAFPALALQPGVTFTDVGDDHENKVAIEYLQKRGVIQGYPDNTFKPDNRINRAEFVRIVASPAVLTGERVQDCIPEHFSMNAEWIYFSDVARGEWYAPYVCIAKVKDIVGGYPDGSFKPADYISFVEAAKILTGIFAGTLKQDEDVWYRPYVEKLAELKAIPTSVMSLEGKITRGEMAEMIQRLMAKDTTKASKTADQLMR